MVTRMDMLGKALSVAADARGCAKSRRRTFGDALLKTMSAAGDFHATLAVPVYPRDAQRRDLETIGKDMYRAFGEHVETHPPS